MPRNLQKADRKSKPPIPDLQTFFLQIAWMERHERLKTARERHFRTAKEAALSLGVPYGTYSGHEKGTRGIKDTELELYARRFRVPLPWLALGHGTEQVSGSYTAPVMGFVGAGAEINVGVEQVPPEGFYDIDTIVPLPADVIAFEVMGDSMYPRYDPGDVIVCYEKGMSPAELPNGIHAAVLLDDGRRFLKRVRHEPGGSFTLESHNAPPIFGAHVEWAADILATIPANRWSKVTNGHRKPRLKAGA